MAHIDFARAFNAFCERLIEGDGASSGADHRFVSACQEHVARVVDWFE
jgi:hypothetical protein